MDFSGAARPRTDDVSGRGMGRRTFLLGAAAATVGGLVLHRTPRYDPVRAVTMKLTAEPEVAPAAGTSLIVKAVAGQSLLLDPNRGNRLAVILPLAGQGGVRPTTILPGAGAPPRGKIWTRTLSFQQPYSGAVVNPNLPGIGGSLPRWGSKGAGSVDVVRVSSSDGRTWSMTSHTAQGRSSARSML